jgi:hypothetical protein
MAPHGVRVQVTDEPTPLCVTENGDLVPGGSLLISNVSAGNLDLGGANVASGAGFELLATDATSAELKSDEILYAVAPDAGPYEVHVLRTGVVQ